MKTSKILALLLVGCIGFAGCDGQKSPPDTTSFSQSLSESSGIGTENFDTLLASIDAHDLVVESIDGSQCSINIPLVSDWIQNYQDGKCGTIAIYYNGGGFPSTIYLIECKGSKEYFISCFSSEMPDAPVTYISNLVVERELDFVFGTDTDIIPFPIVHKKPITEQSVSTDVLISDDALQVAEMVFNNFLGGKQFCNSSYVNVANPAATLLDFCYQITGTATIAGEDCVLVSAYLPEEEILSGMESGNVLAVSKDKTLCFSKNVANGGWTFVWDDNEKAIP